MELDFPELELSRLIQPTAQQKGEDIFMTLSKKQQEDIKYLMLGFLTGFAILICTAPRPDFSPTTAQQFIGLFGGAISLFCMVNLIGYCRKM